MHGVRPVTHYRTCRMLSSATFVCESEEMSNSRTSALAVAGDEEAKAKMEQQTLRMRDGCPPSSPLRPARFMSLLHNTCSYRTPQINKSGAIELPFVLYHLYCGVTGKNAYEGMKRPCISGLVKSYKSPLHSVCQKLQVL